MIAVVIRQPRINEKLKEMIGYRKINLKMKSSKCQPGHEMTDQLLASLPFFLLSVKNDHKKFESVFVNANLEREREKELLKVQKSKTNYFSELSAMIRGMDNNEDLIVRDPNDIKHLCGIIA
jgi:hypothetical protein